MEEFPLPSTGLRPVMFCPKDVLKTSSFWTVTCFLRLCVSVPGTLSHLVSSCGHPQVALGVKAQSRSRMWLETKQPFPCFSSFFGGLASLFHPVQRLAKQEAEETSSGPKRYPCFSVQCELSLAPIVKS